MKGLESIALLRHTPADPSSSFRKRRAHTMTTNRFFATVVVGSMLAVAALAQSSDPLVGTWKLNAAKSKGAKAGTTVIESAGKGYKFTVDLTTADGTENHWGFTADIDGKDHPITGTSPYGNAVALTRVNARTLRMSNKQDGKPTSTTTIVVSADGKTRTATTKGKNAKGEPVDAMSLYEKQ
jgi:hypothetical protein